MKKTVSILCIIAMLFTTSCATIFSGGRKNIRFESNPPGATVQINGIDVGKTPCVVPVKRKLSDQVVDMKLKGYQTRTFTLEKGMSGTMWLDAVGLVLLVIPGLVAIGVDLATGSAVDYDHSHYNMELEAK